VVAIAVFVATFDNMFTFEAWQPLASFVRASSGLTVFAVLYLKRGVPDLIIEKPAVAATDVGRRAGEQRPGDGKGTYCQMIIHSKMLREIWLEEHDFGNATPSTWRSVVLRSAPLRD